LPSHFQRLRAGFCAKGFSLADAEDLAQGVLFKACQVRDRHRGEGPLEAWLDAIARNAAVDEWRRRRRASFDELDEAIADHAPCPDRRVVGRDAYRRVAAAIDSLPARMRACIVLSASGLPPREIAGHLRIAVSTVKVQLWSARRRLRAGVLNEPARAS